MQCRLPRRIGAGEKTPSEYAITLTGTMDSTNGYVTINETKYYTSQTLTVSEGATIEVFCGAGDSNAPNDISLNGSVVAAGKGALTTSYSFVPSSNAVIDFAKNTYQSPIGGTVTYYTCAITTE